MTDEKLKAQLVADFVDISVTRVDLDGESAATTLESALLGTDAVVACVGNRQPGLERWAARGGSMVVDAMNKARVGRLVVLSSMGIGDDFMPRKGIRAFWGVLLATAFRGIRKDLTGLEAAVVASGVDSYLLVRAVGLTPDRSPCGEWKLLTEARDGEMDISVAKMDVARFMVNEAINPTLKNTAVTIGHPKKK